MTSNHILLHIDSKLRLASAAFLRLSRSIFGCKLTQIACELSGRGRGIITMELCRPMKFSCGGRDVYVKNDYIYAVTECRL